MTPTFLLYPPRILLVDIKYKLWMLVAYSPHIVNYELRLVKLTTLLIARDIDAKRLKWIEGVNQYATTKNKWH